MIENSPKRIVEVYVGEYASGKSENAVNRAIELKNFGRQITLVDLDLVDPFYTIRPIKKELEKKGINVIAWETEEIIGLGEAGCTIMPAMKWVLRRKGDIIIDVGYGTKGTKVLNLIEQSFDDPDLRILAVINIARPMTSTIRDIVDYLRELGEVDGLINNSHLGDDTSIDFVLEGEKKIIEAGKILGIPVIATAVEESFIGKIPGIINRTIPIRSLNRYMYKSFW